MRGSALAVVFVQTVEDSVPVRLRALSDLPLLANGPVPLRCPGNSVPNGSACFRVRALAFEDYATAYESSVEFQRSTAIVNPSLVPSAPLAVVEVDAPAAAAVDGAPGFEERAAL